MTVSWFRALLLVLGSALAAACQPSPPSATPPPTEADQPPGELQVSASIAEPAEGCLPQAVKDLGLSAKRDGQQLRWKVAGKMLHAAIADGGGMIITAERAAPHSSFLAVARWEHAIPGGARAELEGRLEEMVRKVGLFCGQLQTEVRCVRRGPDGEVRCR